MGRFACPGGRISSAQLRAVAGAVAEHGCGFADVTTRRDLLLEVPDAALETLQPSAAERGVGEEGAGAVARSDTAAADSAGDPVGVHEQQPGLFWIGVPLIAGRMSAGQLRKVADLAERYGDATVQLTARQGLTLLNIPHEKVVNVLEGLQSVDLKPGGPTVRRGLVACSQTESCVEGWAELSRRAREIVEHLERQLHLGEPLRIRVSGPSCACPVGEEQVLVHAVGPGAEQRPVSEQSRDAYDVRVGGRLLTGGVGGEEVKFLLERLLVSWKRGREPEESLAGFCDRVGYELVARQLLASGPVSAEEVVG